MTGGPPAAGEGRERHEIAGAPEAPRQRRDSSRLQQEEILATSAGDASEVVRLLRPQWLRTRGATSLNTDGIVRVYVDGAILVLTK